MALDDPENKKKLNFFMAEHAPLINMHANKLKNAGFIPKDLDINDIHMAGVYGLMDALHKYKPDTSGGKNFADYAHARIRGSMLEHVKQHTGIPKHLITQAKNLRALENKAAPVKDVTAEVKAQTENPAVPKPTTPKPEGND